MSYFATESLPQLQLPVNDPQAVALNQQLQAGAVYQLLSPCGKGLFYPKQGLLLQAEEAAKSRYNGTVGIALDDGGQPMHYRSIAEKLNLDATCCVPYASSYGLPSLRQLWRKRILQKNPDLGESAQVSLPVVTSGITHGLWIAFQMFLGRGEELLLPNLYWPNYRLIAQNQCGARIKCYNTFDSGGLDLAALDAVLQEPGSKKILLFNFPHNPTGYSPQQYEVQQLQDIFLRCAESGKQLLILCDDAYWGLCYEVGTERQSLFAFVAGLHPNIVAIKLDGATKEDFSWGLRIGFISFGLYADPPHACSVLEQKAGAAVRLSVSNCSRLSQELLLSTYRDERTRGERKYLQKVLAGRYRKVRQCLEAGPKEWSQYLSPLPFNSGYFMTFALKNQSFRADELRLYLLSHYDIGLIALQDKYLRFAFSAVAEHDIPHVLHCLHQACGELLQINGSNPRT